MKTITITLLLATCAMASLAQASDCFLPAGAKVAVGISTVAPEMAATIPGDPLCVDASLVLARLRVTATAPVDGAYVPRTKDDNTPWRFDMSQNGKRMTAEEFDTWMKAKGIRVATGKPAVDPAEAQAATTAAAAAATAK